MKRLPLAASFLLFILLCVSLAYWAMQLFKPPLRPVAAPPRAVADIRPQAAATLFGGRAGPGTVASNYHLNGVVMAGNSGESQAILSVDGKPAKAVQAGKELAPGVTVKEVHSNYVLLSDNGVTKRVELPQSAKVQVDYSMLPPVRSAPASSAAASSAPGGGGAGAPANSAAQGQPAQGQSQAPAATSVPNAANGNASQSGQQNAVPNAGAPAATMTAPPSIVVRPPSAGAGR